MTPLEYAPKDSAPRSAPVRFLVRNNPFYLLSAMCMLAGCLALTNSLSWTSIGLGRLLALVLTLNVYEGLLLCLGLFLLARRGIVRDGLVLLLLEALFLVDAAFLNVEVFSVDLHVGLWTNAIIYLLAVAKLFLVFRALGLATDRTFAFVLMQVTALFVLPGTFAVVARDNGGYVSPRAAYAAWWAVGTLAALSSLMVRPRDENDRHVMAPAHHAVGSLLRKTFVGLPFVSLLVHLVMLHWVYKAQLFAADFSPVLLGLTVALGRVTPRPKNKAAVALVRVWLPVLAVMLSYDAASSLRLAPLGGWGRPVTPMALAVAAAYLVYVYLYFARYVVPFLGGWVLMVIAYLFGPSPDQVAAGTRQGVDWGFDAIDALIPKTTAGWGVTAVVAAFAFLGVGAAISLRRPPVSDDDLPSEPPEPAPTPPVAGDSDVVVVT